MAAFTAINGCHTPAKLQWSSIMKGLKLTRFTGCAIFLAVCGAVWVSSSTVDNTAGGHKFAKGTIE